MAKSSDSESENDFLQSGKKTQEILTNSESYCKFMPSTDTLDQSADARAQSQPSGSDEARVRAALLWELSMRTAVLIAASQVQRLTACA
ncbi:unnamed protein product [Peronospora destructor]|uniref:Uncharacterized protein n=1 Tax=Peronospora destructor TaxID=86335 RepID=A0AAV0VCM6_9STRA|nr:unnamed protein product [Peronospora destructor]